MPEGLFNMDFMTFFFATCLPVPALLRLILSAERAAVLAVLRDLHFLDGFPQAGSVPGAVLAGDPNLLCSLGHLLALTSFSCRSESSNISLGSPASTGPD